MQMKIKNNEKYSIFFATAFTGIILLIMAWQLTVPVISDETITMANAAWLNGYDWQMMIASLGGFYYRFGQALLTLPFFHFLKEPEMIYRCSMMLQALIHVSIVPVVYIILIRHMRMRNKNLAALLSMVPCFVPALVLYLFYYRGDFLLSVLPWYVLLAFLETMHAEQDGKNGRRIVWTVVLSFFAVYSYTAHTRGIIVLIALVITAFFVHIFLKRKSVFWCVFVGTGIIFMFADFLTGKILKSALYSLGGIGANSLETGNMGNLFSIFSYDAIKDFFMICLSWMHTLIISNQGLVLIGAFTSLFVLGRAFTNKGRKDSEIEKIVIIFCVLIFFGYYVAGALYARGSYLELYKGILTRRSDRLLYDRYAICGAGMIIFVALYGLCVRKDWLKWKGKLFCGFGALVVFLIWFKKILPTAVKYPGYLYNTIILNTFQKIEDPSKVMWGQPYSREGLLAITALGLGLMAAILLISFMKKRWMPYLLLGVVLVSDLALIRVNYAKVRKATNDYTVDATAEVVDFMQEFESEITEEYPYILKGGLSGIKIQFYQSQLMNYRMFGKNQEAQLNLDNYFIISAHDDINLTWYEDDYYLFEDYDYAHAEYDVVYVKGDALKDKMEELGYDMRKYVPEE